MALSKRPELDQALVTLIDAWKSRDHDGFRTILNNALDICDNTDWLATKLAMHIGETPRIILSWRKGGFWPSIETQKRLVALIKQLIVT